MKFKLLTIFPEMLEAVLDTSILARARRSGAIETQVIDIRPFSRNKHKNTDDAPFGGGAGMVMTPQPTLDALRFACGEHFRGRRIYLSPRGERFTQKKAEELSRCEELVLLCGHYEGLDQRVIDLAIDEEISVGDYVLTGGELGALIITDAVARLLPGVLGCDESSVDESFSSGLLEYPQYTRPREIEGLLVPEVLLNGNQKQIDRWRRDEALRVTRERRPDLLETALLDKDDRALLRAWENKTEKPRVCVLSENAERAQLFWSRMIEESRSALAAGTLEQCDCLIVLDGKEPEDFFRPRTFLPRPPRNSELQAAQDRGLQLCGFSPYAFDYNILRRAGDEGLKEALLTGLSDADFVCLALRLLPIRRLKPGVADWGKSRRALKKPGESPRALLTFSDGCREEHALNAQSQALVRALCAFAQFGTPPVPFELERDAAGFIGP